MGQHTSRHLSDFPNRDLANFMQ